MIVALLIIAFIAFSVLHTMWKIGNDAHLDTYCGWDEHRPIKRQITDWVGGQK
jgi:hypothetical protein